jgi:uncharacterized protein YndB with AHSA1/START domain
MGKKIVIERTYEAPMERVWEALTNKDQMKHWYFEVDDFKAEVGFEFQFSGEGRGKIYLHKCKVVEANPITKVAYTWGYDGYVGQSLVTFELFNEGKNKTRLKLTHSGLDTFPTENFDFSEESFNEGWTSILGQSLRKFVETDSFTKSIRINAGLKDIWDIVLHPDHQWGLAFGGGATAETDWKEGSSIIWRDTQNNIGANGIVEVHQPEKCLQLHYYDDVKPKPEAKLGQYYEMFSITADNGQHLLSVEIGKMDKKDIPSHQIMWERALSIIKELAEKKDGAV